MGNSSYTLQNIVDEVSVIGDLNPILINTGGFASEPALTIGNDVMSELISARFPWKWNRMKLLPFPLTTYQQDYASVNVTTLGWLESCVRIDINNTQVPPPSWPVYAVRDLALDNAMAGFPGQICWFPNDQLEQGIWPGPGVKYTWPIGPTVATVNNPITNILDDRGNILVLTTYGTTGLIPPQAVYPPPTTPPTDWEDIEKSLIGQQIQDGTCVWTVANPKAAGLRVFPRPPAGGNVWLMRVFAQHKARTIWKITQKLNPIPDDYIKWFRDGFVAYAHRYSSNPTVAARFEQKRQNWLNAVDAAARQGDREDESKGFFPDTGIMSPSYVQNQGPYPYRWGWWG
jgi:hypothetical protein